MKQRLRINSACIFSRLSSFALPVRLIFELCLTQLTHRHLSLWKKKQENSVVTLCRAKNSSRRILTLKVDSRSGLECLAPILVKVIPMHRVIDKSRSPALVTLNKFKFSERQFSECSYRLNSKLVEEEIRQEKEESYETQNSKDS